MKLHPFLQFPRIGRVIIALLLAAASDFLYATLAFIHAQPAGAMRGLWLLFLPFHGPELAISLGVFCVALWFIRPTKAALAAAIAALLVSSAFWSFVNEPPLSDWLLPPVHGK